MFDGVDIGFILEMKTKRGRIPLRYTKSASL